MLVANGRTERWARLSTSPWWVYVPVLVYAVRTLLRGYDGILGTLEDDAYYYLVAAEQFIRTGAPTFDGETPTNGYHPLWFGLNALLVWICDSRRAVYVPGLVVLCALFACLHAHLVLRLLGKLTSSRFLASAVTLLVVTRSNWLIFSGMECALTMPLLVWAALVTLGRLNVDEAETPSSWYVRFGLLTSAIGLARIDAIVFGLGAAFVVLLRSRLRIGSVLRAAGGFGIGLVPFMLYLLSNAVIFGSLLTVSAQAKNLAPGLTFNTEIFRSVSFGAKVLFLYVPVIGALLLASPWSPWQGPKLRLSVVVFGFPILFYLLLASRSTWQIWVWYQYPLPLAMAVAMTALGDALRLRLGRVVTDGRSVLLVALTLAMCLSSAARNPIARTDGVRRSAQALASFAREHPGRYAMGDRAGLTAFLSPVRFVQLEGLMADRRLLETIRAEEKLEDALGRFRIDYLVEALPTVEVARDSCHRFEEPKARQAGTRSPKLRGVFCDPILRYDDPGDGHTTLVFATNRGQR